MNKTIICVALIGLLCGCTVINREYFVNITVCENSTVNFDPEIMADIKKKTEAEKKTHIQTDADVDASLY